jgi:hypothetical protein
MGDHYELEVARALTFDDILLVPDYSEVVPSAVQTKAFFARDLFHRFARHLERHFAAACLDHSPAFLAQHDRHQLA